MNLCNIHVSYLYILILIRSGLDSHFYDRLIKHASSINQYHR